MLRGPGLGNGLGAGVMGMGMGSSGTRRGRMTMRGSFKGSSEPGGIVPPPSPPSWANVLIDKLGMRANAITKSFFMFVFMIVLILRLTPKIRK